MLNILITSKCITFKIFVTKILLGLELTLTDTVNHGYYVQSKPSYEQLRKIIDLDSNS